MGQEQLVSILQTATMSNSLLLSNDKRLWHSWDTLGLQSWKGINQEEYITRECARVINHVQSNQLLSFLLKARRSQPWRTGRRKSRQASLSALKTKPRIDGTFFKGFQVLLSAPKCNQPTGDLKFRILHLTFNLSVFLKNMYPVIYIFLVVLMIDSETEASEEWCLTFCMQDRLIHSPSPWCSYPVESHFSLFHCQVWQNEHRWYKGRKQEGKPPKTKVKLTPVHNTHW